MCLGTTAPLQSGGEDGDSVSCAVEVEPTALEAVMVEQTGRASEKWRKFQTLMMKVRRLWRVARRMVAEGRKLSSSLTSLA